MWVDALRKFFDVLSKDEYSNVTSITMNYNFVRPSGARLVTFGGTASGPEPLMEMFDSFMNAISNKIDPYLKPLEELDGYVQVRPITVIDMMNAIGYNVVVGGKPDTSCLQR